MASSDQSIVLITGANGGIGFELAAQLLADASKFVLLGSRSLEKGEAAVKQLKSKGLPGKVEVLQIDVNSEDSITKAAKEVEEKYARLDALVNNAAITCEPPTSASLSTRLSAAFLTNTTGPAVVVETFAPLLEKSTAKTPRIINVTSGAGSISLRLGTTNPHQKMKMVPYRVSKAALNMLTACQAYEYGEKGWKVFCFCPGFTESGIGPMNKVEYGAKPTSEGAAPMVEILKGERDAEHGGFLKAGGVWPW
ncbi:NAD(P)-binding protein [Clathrospora elynae]|uniref:NAD(P)-binding protein n=1 Tax=Clathrospora elynae TaxID=706981 RepID=A0A6A5T2Y2_9PLEO|nr:NAD(P)-binding protein [Clathrospora elynae]